MIWKHLPGFFLTLAFLGCEKPKKVIEPWMEGNIALQSIPDAWMFKSYRKQFGERDFLEGDIQIYVITWFAGERRLRFRDDKLEIEYPIEKTLWENSWIENKDSAERYSARFATEEDSLPPLHFKSYTLEGSGGLYDSLVAIGIDTMTSPSREAWDLHDGVLLIIEYFGPRGLNIFQIPLSSAELDDRYIWIYNRIMPLDPGYSTSPGLKYEWDPKLLYRLREIHRRDDEDSAQAGSADDAPLK